MQSIFIPPRKKRLLALLTGLLASCAPSLDGPAVAPSGRPASETVENRRAVELLHTAGTLRESSAALEAIALTQQALGILQRTRGRDHPEAVGARHTLAVLRADLGDYVAADSMLRDVLSTRERDLPRNDPRIAESLNSLALVQSSLGHADRAAPLLQRALAIRRESLGRNHPDVAATLVNISLLQLQRARPESAEVSLRRALKIFKRHPEVRKSEYAAARSRLAGLYLDRGKESEALAVLEPQASPRSHRWEGNSLSSPDVLRSLGELYEQRGELAKAEDAYGRALLRYEVLQQVYGGVGFRSSSVGDVARVRFALGRVRRQQDDFPGADSMLSMALPALEKTLGAYHHEVADAQTNLALLYSKRGEHDRADSLFRRAVTINEVTWGSEHPRVAFVMRNWAGALEARGDMTGAVAKVEREIEILRRAYGGASPTTATALNHLAVLRHSMGDHVHADSLLRDALDVHERTAGPRHPDLASVLENLARIAVDRGNFGEADLLLTRSLGILEGSSASQPEEVAQVLVALAEARTRAGRPADAPDLLRRAVDLYEGALGPEHPRLARPLRQMAVLHVREGRITEAETLLRRALAIDSTTLGVNHPEFVRSLLALATLHDARGDTASAMRAWLQAGRIQVRNLPDLLAFGSDRQKKLDLEEFLSWSEQTISLSVGLPRDTAVVEAAMNGLLARKGLALDMNVNLIEAARRRMDPADQRILEELARAGREWARLVHDVPIEGTVSVQRRIEELERRTKQLERELSVTGIIDGGGAIQGLDPDRSLVQRVQGELPPDATLVEFIAYQPRSISGTPVAGGPRYAAFVLQSEGSPIVVSLESTDTIDRVAESFQVQLAGKGAEVRRRARELARLVMDSVEDLVHDDSVLLIAPDGPLHMVPFGALVGKTGEYLVDRHAFAYLTTGRDLLPRKAAQASLGPPVIVANPTFTLTTAPRVSAEARGGSEARQDGHLKSWNSLPSTRVEATLLHRIFPAATILDEESATEAAVKRIIRPVWLHIATHGFFEPPGNTPLGLAPALLRSGIVLAGVNDGRSGEDEDGLLTALEVAGMDFRGTRLVVLSACETGMGEVRNNDGVYGLRRALVIAGARTHMVSLWQVESRATRNLMAEVYGQLRDRTGLAQAIRAYQKANSKQHPYFWAGFIPVGDWRALELVPAANS
ncbi:MAG: tetratricopeptide repeat protein [Longimicrobiaceae bacterium]